MGLRHGFLFFFRPDSGPKISGKRTLAHMNRRAAHRAADYQRTTDEYRRVGYLAYHDGCFLSALCKNQFRISTVVKPRPYSCASRDTISY